MSSFDMGFMVIVLLLLLSKRIDPRLLGSQKLRLEKDIRIRGVRVTLSKRSNRHLVVFLEARLVASITTLFGESSDLTGLLESYYSVNSSVTLILCRMLGNFPAKSPIPCATSCVSYC